MNFNGQRATARRQIIGQPEDDLGEWEIRDGRFPPPDQAVSCHCRPVFIAVSSALSSRANSGLSRSTAVILSTC